MYEKIHERRRRFSGVIVMSTINASFMVIAKNTKSRSAQLLLVLLISVAMFRAPTSFALDANGGEGARLDQQKPADVGDELNADPDIEFLDRIRQFHQRIKDSIDFLRIDVGATQHFSFTAARRTGRPRKADDPAAVVGWV